MKFKLARIVAVLLVVIVSGCTSMQVSQRQNELKAKMDPLLGKSKEEVVLALGVPQEVVTVGGLEVLKYYQSYGMRTQAAVAPNPYLVSGSARSWEAYDTINAYFQNGVMVKWDGYVQR
jgi:hypothetical protein